jgi:hypothetical protein
MLTSRRLHVVALICATAPWVFCGPSFALPGSEPPAASKLALVQLVARKGTRIYDAATETPHDTTSDQADQATEAQALADCIAIWDEGTHITKSKWGEICQRQLKERGAQLSGH